MNATEIMDPPAGASPIAEMIRDEAREISAAAPGRLRSTGALFLLDYPKIVFLSPALWRTLRGDAVAKLTFFRGNAQNVLLTLTYGGPDTWSQKPPCIEVRKQANLPGDARIYTTKQETILRAVNFELPAAASPDYRPDSPIPEDYEAF